MDFAFTGQPESHNRPQCHELDMDNFSTLFPASPSWRSATDLDQLLRDAMRQADHWASENCWRFNMIYGSDDLSEIEASRHALVCLSHYLHVGNQLGETSLDDIFTPSLLTYVNSTEFLRALHSESELLLDFGIALALLKARGRLSNPLENAVTSLLSDDAIWLAQECHSQRLRLWNIARLLDVRRDDINIENVINQALNTQTLAATASDEHRLTEYCECVNNLYDYGATAPKQTLPESETRLATLLLRFCAKKNDIMVLKLLNAMALQQLLPDWLLRFSLSCLLDDTHEETAPEDANDNAYQHWRRHYEKNLLSASVYRLVLVRRNRVNSDCKYRDRTCGEADLDSLAACGHALAALADDEFYVGVFRTHSAIKNATSLSRPFLQQALDFIARQRNANGSFGNWERAQQRHIRDGGDIDSFFRDKVLPTHRLCEELTAKQR